MKRKILKIVLAIVLVGLLVGGGLTLFAKHQMGKVPGLTFAEALEYTTHGNADAVITVGVIEDGRASFTVYGEDSTELPRELHTYEIGSITKTFTAAMVSQAIGNGLIELDASIDQYLDLPAGIYPSIEELLTHTSGYKNYYFEQPMASNFLHGRNSFYGVTDQMVLDRLGKVRVDEGKHPFDYSNFGYAVLGLVLESVYGQDYAKLANEFASTQLGLNNTHISDGSGDLGNYWDWNADDAYLSAGALTSDIDNMLSYLQMQMDGDPCCVRTHEQLREITTWSEEHSKMGLNTDAVGMAWMIDKENNIIWHNGGTGDYNSYIGFDPDTQVGVVVLSNLSPSSRIPATILGPKLLAELKH